MTRTFWHALIMVAVAWLSGLLWMGSNAPAIAADQAIAPLSRLSRETEFDGALVTASSSITLHATLSASDHEVDGRGYAVDPETFTLQDATVRGIPHKAATLLVRPGTELSSWCHQRRGKRIVITLWEVPQ